ncbi:hypothetical protein K2O51_30945 (plasmid) [Cupriavidus pinatubonensis]|uniref:hypothetical protein n=1 Tax=Cupriavidus pinatubonensis TaxID=248026 RepID=UPI001C7311B1|nr:hypothetical protein [Cupriavidus pinatubonensis]QYY33667.1 hypothetical protein K2O51_30945 [Cupriavidus pinatubonensis]
MNEQQRTRAEALLSNDETSTDEDLVELFAANGIARPLAVAAVARRMEFLNQDLNNPPRLGLNSKGEHWIVDGKDGNGWLLIDEASADASKFGRAYGSEELAHFVAASLNAA